MVVQRFRTHHVAVPLERRMTNGSFDFDTVEHILFELDVGDATGIGHAFAFERRQAESIRVMVLDLAEGLVGHSVEAVRAVWGGLWQRLSYIGRAGPPVMALSVVDTALWDLLAQRAGLPLFRLLGAARTSVPVYATGGWLTYSKEELVEEALGLRERGFANYKMKVGNEDWSVDVDRVAHLSEAVGGEMGVMVDANQGWSVPQAIAAGRALRELGVGWFEEPVAVEDVAGSARVAAAVDIPLAAGESLFTRHDFVRLIESRAADVAMPDLMRSGGPGEFMQIATLADAHDMPVSSHAFTEVSAHLMAACSNASFVESIPGWSDDLFDTPPQIADGHIHLPETPGLGFKFDEKIIREQSVEVAPWR